MPRKGQRLRGSWFNCLYCEQKFWRQRSWLKKWVAKYCSEFCRNKSLMIRVDNEKEVCELYASGESVNKCCLKFNLSKSVVDRVLKTNGFKKRSKSFYLRGDKNHNYKGGHITKFGYKRISYGGKQEFEHREKMKNLLGRDLKKNEHVHHLNGNKLDNRIENLALLTSKHHGALHAKEFKDWKNMYYARIAYLESIIGQCENCKNK